MAATEETLVVTSAVRTTDRHVVVKDADARLEQLYWSLVAWITRSSVRNIVLCDNTMPDHSFSGLRALAARHGRRLEILLFEGDRAMVARYGKGRGEGEILRHVLEHSSLLRAARTFYKVTGRVFVDNFDAIARTEDGHDTVFNLQIGSWKKGIWRLLARTPAGRVLCDRGRGHVQTVFYKCGVRYYREHLLHSHTGMDDRAGRTFESQMFWPIMRHGFRTFRVPPRLVGVCAGTGEPYGDAVYPHDVVLEARALLQGGRVGACVRG